MATHQIKITSPYREVTEEDKHLVQVRIDPEEIMSFLPTNFMFGESRITLPIRYFRLVHINGQPKFVKHDEDSWRDILAGLRHMVVTIDCTIALTLALMYWMDHHNIPIRTNWIGVGSFSQTGLVTQLRHKTSTDLFSYPIQEQQKHLPNQTSYCYVRGCSYYNYFIIDKNIHPPNFQTSYQGENCLYLGNDKFLTFWRNKDHTGTYKIVSYQEMLSTLHRRGIQEWLANATEDMKEKIPEGMKQIQMISPTGGVYPTRDLLVCGGVENCIDMYVDVTPLKEPPQPTHIIPINSYPWTH